MDKWLRSTFKIVTGGWANAHGTKDDAFTWSEGTKIVSAPVGWFEATFGAVASPPTAAALKAIDPTDKLGWHQHFDAWSEAGVITAQ